MSRLYIGLPEEFSPPDRAAALLAGLASAGARLAMFERVPAMWRPWVLHETKRAIAERISEMPEKVARQEALARVPDEWRAEVRALAKSFWETAPLRQHRRVA